MSRTLISEVIDSYAKAAGRLIKAGLDGIEVPASHGLLPAQFLNANVNVRDDEYGGDLRGRMLFLCRIIESIRLAIGENRVLGIRISIDEMEHNGLTPEETCEICAHLDAMDSLDYFNVIAGSMAGLAGSVHVVPPMMIPSGYTQPLATSLRNSVNKPIFLAGRINQPQLAEQILEKGAVQMCGMTRALISDPELPTKVAEDRLDEIRACIGCNQACIGHYHLGTAISCIQFPTTGRERQLTPLPLTTNPKQVAIAGSGPAGLQAAISAAKRGHSVTVYEKTGSIGGQVNLAQTLPDRSEFGGLITNLASEARRIGVSIELNTEINGQWLESNSPDTVVVATGARPRWPNLPGAELEHVVDAWSLLNGQAKPGGNVLVADSQSDWIGLGLAEWLAQNGSRVTLAVNGVCAGEGVQSYARDLWVGRLHKLGVIIITYARLFGIDEDSAYLQHTTSGEPIILSDIDMIALTFGHQSNGKLESELETLSKDLKIEYHLAGDCLSPRSAEEAVYEGMMVGRLI